jgi:hypothetical protein
VNREIRGRERDPARADRLLDPRRRVPGVREPRAQPIDDG